MSEELNAAIAWLTEYIDMREHVRSEPVHYLRKHLDAITAARARIAELEAQVEKLSRPIEDHVSEYRHAAKQAVRTSVDALGRLDLVHQELSAERTARLATQRALWSPEHVFAVCRMLRDAACSGISRDQFHAGLSIGLGGCDREYADNVFCNFQDNPAAFLASRVPSTQSIELLKIMLEKHAVAQADGKEAV